MTKLEPETPATGILVTGAWGDMKQYHIQCECGHEDDAHDVTVEVDDLNIQVHIYVTAHTKWWELNRWKQMWQILTKGYATMQSTLVMTPQTAVNYAATLKSAVEDMSKLKEGNDVQFSKAKKGG